MSRMLRELRPKKELRKDKIGLALTLCSSTFTLTFLSNQFVDRSHQKEDTRDDAEDSNSHSDRDRD